MVVSSPGVAPIDVMLPTLASEEGCVVVRDPGTPADSERGCDEFGAGLVGPANPEELDNGNGPDVEMVEAGMLVLGIPVNGVTTEPVKEITGVPELGLGLMTELATAPIDVVLSWPLNVTAPVTIEVSIGPEDEPPPVVRVAKSLGPELVGPADELLLEMPDGKGVGSVSVPVNEPESVSCVLIVDKGCEGEPGPVNVPPLVMLTDGREVGLVKFVAGYGPEVKKVTGEPVSDPELVSKADPLDIESKLVAETGPCEVRGEPVIETVPDVSSVLNDGTNPEVTVALGIVKGGFVEREPGGPSEPPVPVVGMLPELNPVSDPDGTMLLGTGSVVELAREKGGMDKRGPVGVSEFPAVFDAVLLWPELVLGVNTVPFNIGTSTVRVVPMIVVGSSVSVVIVVIVFSTTSVIVVPDMVVGVIVNVSMEVEISELSALSEFGGIDRLLLVVAVEFVTGYGAELVGCSDMAPELPLALVRLPPEEDSEIGAVPKEIDDVSVAMDVIDPPLGPSVGLTRLNVPIEELRMDPDGPVDSGGLVPESEPKVDPSENPDVELPTPIVAGPEGVVIASVEKLTPLVRLPLAPTKVKLSEDPGNVIENTPEPKLLENPVGPTVDVIPDPVLPVGYGPVPDTVSLELLSGKGAVDKVLGSSVPEEIAVSLLVVVDSRAVEREPVGKDPIIVEGGPVPRILLGTVCELFCEAPIELVICPGGFPPVGSLAETEPMLGLVGALVPVIEPPVGPTAGTEEFVLGNGVTSLPVRELTAPVFVSDVRVNDSEIGIVKEPGPLNEAFVALADESDEFVSGKGVASVTPEDVPVRPMVGVISLPVRPGPDVTRLPVSPAEPFVGLITEPDEFVNGNGVDSLLVIEVRLPVVVFISGKGAVPVLREPVMFAETDVGIDGDPVFEVSGPVAFD
ncbi:hypothetical protein F4803DRAFT_558860 [Xylaria telfairii]|nr:hypothetical protein F4803DRAFT_558860 [Xylaria telfairii]